MKKIKLSSASNTYITGMIAAILTLFIVSGVVFLLLISNKLDIVMSSPSGITYTYFMMIMDRIIALILMFVILPLSIFQWVSKDEDQEKSAGDKVVGFVSVLIILVLFVAFWGGELRFYNKYTDGELRGAKLFSTQTLEMKIFDKLGRR